MAIGNNSKANKILNITLPLVDIKNPLNIVSGRYYFNDNPIINKSIIVGIQSHNSVAPVNDIPFLNYNTLLGLPIVNLFQGSGFTRSCYLTLVNSNKEEILSNYPLTLLFNQSSTNNGKIYNFFLKADMSKSFINVANQFPAGSFILAVNLTFYLK
jgi:hypothetical protein